MPSLSTHSLEAVLFTREGRAFRRKGPAMFGVLDLERDGGYWIPVGAALPVRRGHPFFKPRHIDHEAVLRRNSPLLMVRELDPTPLSPAVGAAVKWQGARIAKDDLKAITTAAERAAEATVARQSEGMDPVARTLVRLLGITVLAAVLVWVMIPILGGAFSV